MKGPLVRFLRSNSGCRDRRRHPRVDGGDERAGGDDGIKRINGGERNDRIFGGPAQTGSPAGPAMTAAAGAAGES
jgi:hypothetical protein